MRRRSYLIAAGGLATIVGSQSITADEDESETGETDIPDFFPEGEEVNPQEFEGHSSEVFEDVAIEGGLTVVSAVYDGPDFGNFIVELVPEAGEFNTLFQNELEPYEGDRGAVLEEDTYLLDVEADGPWELEIYQPRADEGTSPPHEFEGETDRVYGPFEFDGTHIATGSHAGEGNFIVEVLPMGEDEFEELVFNEVGAIERDETTFRFDGIGWVAVQASGEWTLDIE